MSEKNKEFKYAKIIAYYNNHRFESMSLELEDDEIYDLILSISEHGTGGLNALKLPITDSKFILLSREQLDVTVLEISFANRRSKPKNMDNTYMITG